MVLPKIFILPREMEKHIPTLEEIRCDIDVEAIWLKTNSGKLPPRLQNLVREFSRQNT